MAPGKNLSRLDPAQTLFDCPETATARTYIAPIEVVYPLAGESTAVVGSWHPVGPTLLPLLRGNARGSVKRVRGTARPGPPGSSGAVVSLAPDEPSPAWRRTEGYPDKPQVKEGDGASPPGAVRAFYWPRPWEHCNSARSSPVSDPPQPRAGGVLDDRPTQKRSGSTGSTRPETPGSSSHCSAPADRPKDPPSLPSTALVLPLRPRGWGKVRTCVGGLVPSLC